MIAYIESLNDDAMSNQFDILFTDGIPGGGDGNLLRLRMDKQLDIPERSVEEYTIQYQGIKIPKTSLQEETAKEFVLNFRLDGNWQVYRALNNWYKLVFNESNGSGGTEASTRVSMIFNSYGAQKQLIFSMRLNGVKIKKIKLETFDMGSAEPARVEATFIYFDREDLT